MISEKSISTILLTALQIPKITFIFDSSNPKSVEISINPHQHLVGQGLLTKKITQNPFSQRLIFNIKNPSEQSVLQINLSKQTIEKELYVFLSLGQDGKNLMVSQIDRLGQHDESQLGYHGVVKLADIFNDFTRAIKISREASNPPVYEIKSIKQVHNIPYKINA